MNSLGLVLGNQQFPVDYYNHFPNNIYMCEDISLCTHYKYHKHKIMHFLLSMREYRDELVSIGKNVEYTKLDLKEHFFESLSLVIKRNDIRELVFYEIEDKFFEKKVVDFCIDYELKLTQLQSPMFLCSRDRFKTFLANNKPYMHSFYIMMRQEHGVLMDHTKPIGGKWSFDSENRKRIPRDHVVRERKFGYQYKYLNEIKKLIEMYFEDHPGEFDNFWLPVNRSDSLKLLDDFLLKRLDVFGDHQDAIDSRDPFLNHSLLSASINIGHLLPSELIDMAQVKLHTNNLNSVEGFIRQIIGWREFVRGIYQNFSVEQERANFFNHKRKFARCWWSGNTGIEIIDDTIKKTIQYGYAHHIERLMILGNIMLLLEVEPKEVHDWFMSMYIDSSDWVMGPNIFGMSQFSDGGIFATKPYICSSNYLRKMSYYDKGEWCDIVDGLYWSFIERNQDFLRSNPRMSMMCAMVDKISPHRKEKIYKLANEFKLRVTI